jgi:hypothetical protein
MGRQIYSFLLPLRAVTEVRDTNLRWTAFPTSVLTSLDGRRDVVRKDIPNYFNWVDLRHIAARIDSETTPL